MGKPKYDMPTTTFPYKIKKRLNLMSVPRKNIEITEEGMPAWTQFHIRKSALNGQLSDRINDASWPYIRRFLLLKKQCKNRFSQERMERIDRMIEATNATCYAKYANCTIDLKKTDTKDLKKKKAWSDSEWKKHMDYINQIAGPRRKFEPDAIRRGGNRPLSALMPRIQKISVMPEFKVYRRLSQELFYRNPTKVSPAALKYVLTDRTKKLAKPRVLPTGD